jgi:hypothetical protein
MPFISNQSKGSRSNQPVSWQDELRVPKKRRIFHCKRAQKLPHLNHLRDYISVSLAACLIVQQFLWSIALALLSATGG